MFLNPEKGKSLELFYKPCEILKIKSFITHTRCFSLQHFLPTPRLVISNSMPWNQSWKDGYIIVFQSLEWSFVEWDEAIAQYFKKWIPPEFLIPSANICSVESLNFSRSMINLDFQYSILISFAPLHSLQERSCRKQSTGENGKMDKDRILKIVLLYFIGNFETFQ